MGSFGDSVQGGAFALDVGGDISKRCQARGTRSFVLDRFGLLFFGNALRRLAQPIDNPFWSIDRGDMCMNDRLRSCAMRSIDRRSATGGHKAPLSTLPLPRPYSWFIAGGHKVGDNELRPDLF